MKIKKIIYILLIFIALFFNINIINAEENSEGSGSSDVMESVKDGFGLDDYISEIDKCAKDSEVENFDISGITDDLLNGRGVGYNKILTNIVSLLIGEIFSSLKGAILIFIIILLMAVLDGINIDKNSQIIDIAYLVCFITIASVTIVNFTQIISMFKGTVDILTKIIQIVSPFLIAILIGTGAITTTGIIQPLLLFIASLIGFIITYIVIPCITVSIALNVISAMSENFKFYELSKIFNKCSLWVVGIVLTLFLGILSLETSLSSSVDSLTVNVTQAAVSNFVPVVGKFFSDSLETVIGATKIIGKAGGIIGIISIIVISSIPLIKIISVMAVYYLLGAISEPICKDDRIKKYIKSFAEVYKTLLGILVGIDILFVISTGIILNLCGKIGT